MKYVHIFLYIILNQENIKIKFFLYLQYMKEMLEGYFKDIYKHNLYKFLKSYLSYEKADM